MTRTHDFKTAAGTILLAASLVACSSDSGEPGADESTTSGAGNSDDLSGDDDRGATEGDSGADTGGDNGTGGAAAQTGDESSGTGGDDAGTGGQDAGTGGEDSGTGGTRPDPGPVPEGCTLFSHDFDDDDLGPFNACSVKSPNYSRAEDGRLKTFWTQSGYDGSRSTRGAEMCGDGVKVVKHGWYGFTMNLDANYQEDKQAGIAQVFQFASSDFWSWAMIFDMHEGDLTMTHRFRPAGKTDVVLYPDFPKETDMDIVVGFTLSQEENGEIEVWVNGESRYHVTDISFGLVRTGTVMCRTAATPASTSRQGSTTTRRPTTRMVRRAPSIMTTFPTTTATMATIS